MAPAPTLQAHSRIKGNGPRLQIIRHGPPLVGLVFCALFHGSGGPPCTGSGPDQAGQGCVLRPGGLVQFWCGLAG